MKGELHIIKTDGTVESEPLDGEPSLERLHDLLGGYLEVVPGFTVFRGQPCIALCNEEGKLARPEPLPVNEFATLWWWWQLPRARAPYNDPLNGNVVIITGEEILRAMKEDGP